MWVWWLLRVEVLRAPEGPWVRLRHLMSWCGCSFYNHLWGCSLGFYHSFVCSLYFPVKMNWVVLYLSRHDISQHDRAQMPAPADRHVAVPWVSITNSYSSHLQPMYLFSTFSHMSSFLTHSRWHDLLLTMESENHHLRMPGHPTCELTCISTILDVFQ